MENLEEKYQKLLEQKRSIEKIEKYLLQINKEIEAVDHELAFLDVRLKKKNISFERLQKKTPISFFAKIRGNRHRKINKKLSDYHELILQQKSQEKSKQLLEFEEDVLQEQLQKFIDVAEKIKEIEEQIEEQKILAQGWRGRKYIQLRNEVRQLNVNKKEFLELIAAGEVLIGLIKKIDNIINKLSMKQTLLSYTFRDVKFGELDMVRELFPEFKMELFKFDQEHREAFPESPNFRLLRSNREYRALKKALFCPKAFQETNTRYRDIHWFVWQIESKISAKVHAVRKRLKTLERKLDRVLLEEKKLEKIIYNK